MEVADYSPPARPNRAQQFDSLRKGFGRAYRWASSYQLHADLLLKACLTELRFDLWVEKYRGNWLWELVDAGGLVDTFRDILLMALQNLDDESPDQQLCELARHYAQRGDHAFRSALYDIVAQKPVPELPTLGEEELLILDGESGFLFAARVRGERNSDPEWDWDDDCLIREAAERFGGEERIEVLLKGDSSPGVQKFFARWAERRQPRNGVAQWVMPTRSVAEVIEAASSEEPIGWLRGWGMRQATYADLLTVLDLATKTDDPAIAARLLRAFSGGTSLVFDTRFIDLCQHSDALVRRRAVDALGQFRHPQVRAFAEQELRHGLSDDGTVSLFIKNYETGDDRRILEAMTLPDEPNELHWLLMSVEDVLKANPSPEGLPLALTVYAHTPCSFCRSCVSRWLLQQNLAPDWLVEECCHDVDDDCRETFRNPSSIQDGES